MYPLTSWYTNCCCCFRVLFIYLLWPIKIFYTWNFDLQWMSKPGFDMSGSCVQTLHFFFFDVFKWSSFFSACIVLLHVHVYTVSEKEESLLLFSFTPFLIPSFSITFLQVSQHRPSVSWSAGSDFILLQGEQRSDPEVFRPCQRIHAVYQCCKEGKAFLKNLGKGRIRFIQKTSILPINITLISRSESIHIRTRTSTNSNTQDQYKKKCNYTTHKLLRPP